MSDRPDPLRVLREDSDDLHSDRLHPAAPAEIRARGDRIRRRRYGIAAGGAALAVVLVAAPLAVLGSSDEGSAPAPADRPGEAPSSPADPDASGDDAENAPELGSTIPGDFPLAEGWPEPDGDSQLVERETPPIMRTYGACGDEQTLSGAAEGDRLVATLSRPAEVRSRELRFYPSAAEAAAESAALRALYEACPRDPEMGIPVDYVTTVADEDGLGEEAWVARRSFDDPAQPGREAVVAVRVANALLVEAVSDEGGDADALAAEVRDRLLPPVDVLGHLRSADVPPSG